jgi:hypothetical protein
MLLMNDSQLETFPHETIHLMIVDPIINPAIMQRVGKLLLFRRRYSLLS